LVRREVGEDNLSRYCLPNAPLDTSWQEPARVQAQRFFSEHRFGRRKANVAWPAIKYAVGVHGIIMVKQKKAGR
jgi:hypothetical protein